MGCDIASDVRKLAGVAVLKLQENLFGLTASLSIFGFANGMVGIFIPLVLIENGAEVWQVAVFYAVAALVKLCINYPVARYVIESRGVHVALGLGYLAAIAQLAFLQGFVSSSNVWLLVGAAIGMALTYSCIWISQHLHISTVMENSTKSSSVATMESINQVAGVAAPAIGGLIGGLFGPTWLLVAAALVLATSFIPLPMVGRLHQEHTADAERSSLRYSLSGAPKRDLFANFSFNIETVVGVLVWPIFLAVQVGTYREIGYISTAAALVAVITLYIAGRRGDAGKDRRVLFEGALISSSINVVRLFASSTAALTAITAAYRGSLAYGQNAWVSNYYAHAKRRGAPYVMSMEIMCDVSHALLWSILAYVSYHFSSDTLFVTAFTIAAFAAWGCLAITNQHKKPAH